MKNRSPDLYNQMKSITQRAFQEMLDEIPEETWPDLRAEYQRVKLDEYEHRRRNGASVTLQDFYKFDPWTATIYGKGNRVVKSSKVGKYRIVSLYLSDGTSASIYVHQLSAFTALGKIPDGLSVDHINRDKLDNCFYNLRYATRIEQALNRKTAVCSVNVLFDETSVRPGEIFKKYEPPGIAGYYEISNMRRVVYTSPSDLKWYIDFRDDDPKSYPMIRNRGVHIIVAELFIRKLEENEVVKHLNNNSHDSTLSNLEIESQKENMIHAVESNARRTCPTIMCEYDATTGNIGMHLAKFKTYAEIRAATGVTNAPKIITGQAKKAFVKMEGPTWRVGQRVTFIIDVVERDRLDRDRAATKQKQLEDHREYLASRRPVIRKMTMDGNVVLNIYETLRDARVSVFPQNGTGISHCIFRRRESAYGFKWDSVYVDQNNNVIP
jgi:hypothetical protein